VFVAGWSYGNGYAEYAIVAYSSVGVPLWTNRSGVQVYAGGRAPAIAVGGGGNVFVTGGADYRTVAYSGAGVPFWNNGSTNGGGARAAIAVDHSGNVFVTGPGYVTIKYSAQTTPTSPRLDIQNLGNAVVLSWTNATFGLQTAPAAQGHLHQHSRRDESIHQFFLGPATVFSAKGQFRQSKE
jgi:hypothetical protein